MNLLMFLHTNYPYDRRVEREAESLINEGYNVYLLCRGYGKENIHGINVKRVDTPLYYFYSFYGFLTNFSQSFWLKHINEAVNEIKPNAIHIHDLSYAYPAFVVAEEKNIPVILDLHDNIIFQLTEKLWKDWSIKLNPLSYWIYNIKRWKKHQQRLIKKAFHVISVNDESRKYYIKETGISPEDISVVMNVDDPDYLNSFPIDNDVIEKYKNRFVVSYIGSMGIHRGIDVMIKALPIIKKKLPEIFFLVVGPKDKKYVAKLKKLINSLSLSNHVKFKGYVHFGKVPSYIKASQIGIIPHKKGGLGDKALPNKLFQYMALGIPVITSNAAPLKRIINETKAGLIFETDNHKDLAEKVIYMSENGSIAQKMGDQGIYWTKKRYNWKIESRKLIQIYKKIENLERGEKWI